MQAGERQFSYLCAMGRRITYEEKKNGSNAVLCSQFLRDNVDILVLKNVRHNGEKEQQIYMISLIEHKSRVIAMQLLRYMQCIWTEYGKEMERKTEGITKRKSFRYPPILPIVYYEGEERWTADLHLKDRILMNEIFPG